eukprot:3627773-Pleurochrysis_carterae.AAC.1
MHAHSATCAGADTLAQAHARAMLCASNKKGGRDSEGEGPGDSEEEGPGDREGEGSGDREGWRDGGRR